MRDSVNLNVLIVDDERQLRFIISKYLGRRGYNTLRVGTSEEAFEILEQGAVKVVILDIELGEEDGLHVLHLIKKRYIGVAVIILTGRGYDEELWQLARERGADGYLSKTLPLDQIVMDLRRLLKQFESSDSSSNLEAA